LLARLLILLLLLPVLEIMLLVWLGMKTSFLLVVVLVVAASFVGSLIARRYGLLRSIQRVQQEIALGRPPGEALVDALLVALAGLLLMLPGLLSDVMAIALLIPASRRLIKGSLRRRFRPIVMTSQQFTTFDAVSTPARDEVIDVRVIESPRS